MGHGGSSCIETVPPLSKAKSACDAAGAERIPRAGSPILVCLPSAWVRVSVPLLFSGVEVEAGHQHREGHVLGRLQVVAESHLPGARLPGLEVDVDHLALVFIDDEGDAGREPSVLGLLMRVQPDPGPLRPPAAEGEVEDRLVVAEEAERQRVVRVDEGAPRLGRRRGGGQDQEGGQGGDGAARRCDFGNMRSSCEAPWDVRPEPGRRMLRLGRPGGNDSLAVEG